MATTHLALVHLQLARGNFEQGIAVGAACGKAHGTSLTLPVKGSIINWQLGCQLSQRLFGHAGIPSHRALPTLPA